MFELNVFAFVSNCQTLFLGGGQEWLCFFKHIKIYGFWYVKWACLLGIKNSDGTMVVAFNQTPEYRHNWLH
ncbi:MAG: hypothetical protein IPN94_10755 [Sphingobacteriales bacterium]|nr:hypothetical protein [Sphingobacteriales bacterium]